jgi:SAM-dependent methyltransferase/acyl carrier protein
VLEIGCGGSGLTLLHVAPHCQKYIATDIAENSLKNTKAQIEKLGMKLPQVSLLKKEATDFEGFEDNSFDTVILTSVLQYFPSAEYLLKVLEGAIRVTRRGGFIYVGDVRNLALLEVMHLSIQLFRSSPETTASELRDRFKRKILSDQQFAVDPDFFLALPQQFSKVSSANVFLERGHVANDLTKFRYDAIIQIDGEDKSKIDTAWVDWQKDDWSIPKLRRILKEQEPKLFALTGIPNSRVLDDVRVAKLLRNPKGPQHVKELREAVGHEPNIGVDPEDLWSLGKSLSYSVDICWSGRGQGEFFDLVLTRREPDAKSNSKYLFIPPRQAVIKPESWKKLTNDPLRTLEPTQLVPHLRKSLREKLPDYMIPSAFVFLDALPLTPNGKVDRKALPDPDEIHPGVKASYVAPRTPTEKLIAGFFSEVLRIEKAGIHDNFFELGGHSLLATQLFSRIREAFQVDLPLRSLFESPTIKNLAEIIEGKGSELVASEPPIAPISREPRAAQWSSRNGLEVRR